MYAIIMAGGKGERLWPKSTKGKAKHVLAFGTKNVMIHETINRLRQHLPLRNIFLVTTKKQYPVLRPYLSSLEKDNIILEPEGKDTACAICLAELVIEKRFGSSTTVVIPSDHIIGDSDLFFKNLMFAEKIASSDSSLVTIGIAPKYPSIGYGYIKIGKESGGAYPVKKFIEKPVRKKAEELCCQGECFWNSGIFVWRTDSILRGLKRYMPDLYYSLKDIIKMEQKRGYREKLASAYSRLRPLSIDYGVIEPAAKNKTQKIFCVKAEFDWVDIGSWSSIEEIYDKDDTGNIILSNSTLIDVKNCTIIGERGHKIGAIGISDLIIVQTKSGTLVCKRNRAQEVKKLVERF